MNQSNAENAIKLTLPLMQQADVDFAESRYESALRKYATLLEASPSDGYAFYRTTLCLSKLDQNDIARRFFDELPLYLLDQGDYLLALASAKELINLDPNASAIDKVLEKIAQKSESMVQPDSPRKPPKRDPLPEMLSAEIQNATRLVLIEKAEDLCQAALKYNQDHPQARDIGYHPLFSALDRNELKDVLARLELKILAPDTRVIEEGTIGESIFVVIRGSARVEREKKTFAYLRSGAFFGEMALLTQSPRTASVVAAECGLTLFELSKDALNQLALANENMASVLAGYTKDRLLKNLMATSELFLPLDPQRRQSLIDSFDSALYQAGDVILAEGSFADGLKVVLSGEVEVLKKDGSEELRVAALDAGQVFGEISLIKSQPATAKVKALVPTVVLTLQREVFNRSVSEYPEVIAHIYRLALEREEANRNVTQREILLSDDDILL